MGSKLIRYERMGMTFYKEPELERPDLICGWPGIGQIGIMAVDYLRRAIAAEELGEIDPWDFFEPRKVTIRDGLLKNLEFPANKFYYKRLEKKDLVLFIGEEQPTDGATFMLREKNRMEWLILSWTLRKNLAVKEFTHQVPL